MRFILALTLILFTPGFAVATHCGSDAACWEREARQADQRTIDRADATRLREHDASFVRAVQSCKARSGADAYMPAAGEVQIFGTAQQRFDFGKCMNAAGHTVTPK
jgi:hypothetical protein